MCLFINKYIDLTKQLNRTNYVTAVVCDFIDSIQLSLFLLKQKKPPLFAYENGFIQLYVIEVANSVPDANINKSLVKVVF